MTIKSYTAATDIKAGTIVKFSADDTVTPSTSAKDAHTGVNVLDIKKGEQASVEHNDVASIVYGGTVNAGDKLTSDANGHAVVAAEDDVVIAQALAGASTGDYKQAVIR